MDPDLERLCGIPGHDDLSSDQVAYVMQVHQTTVNRLVAGAKIESKRHAGRGTGKQPRLRISRAAVIRYLVTRTTGDRSTIIAAVKQLCPRYLPAIADLMPGAAPLPENVIPMQQASAEAAKAARCKGHDWHPAQLALFNDFPAAS